MTRRQPKVKYAFHRFLEGIFSYHFDKGMPKTNAKLRMYKEAYDVCFQLAKEETDVPDHALVATLQHASRHLNSRGAAIAKLLKEEPENKDQLRKALHDIKKAKDASDNFITTYRGENNV